MKTKYEIGTLFPELTRRCNMRCGHCMRGAAQCKDMSDDVMDALVSKLSGVSVGMVVMGGGENSLVPERVETFFGKLFEAGIYPGDVVFVTNLKNMNQAFMDAIAYVHGRCEVSVDVSYDDQHERVTPSKRERLETLKDVTSDANRFHEAVMVNFRAARDGGVRRYQVDEVLKMGRGATEFGGTKPVTVRPYNVISKNDNFSALCEDNFYVDVYGNVWPHCDLSYNFMKKRKEYSLGSVTDQGFDWLEAAAEFNVDHADEFPIALVEPGCEEDWHDDPYVTPGMRENYDEYIEESINIIGNKKKGITA